MMNSSSFFSKIISYLFHPLLLPTFGLYIIFHLDDTGLWVPPLQMQLFLYGFTFITTFILPFVAVLFLLKAGQVSSLEMPTKEERKIPYLIASICYFSESYILMNMNVLAIIQALMLAVSLLVFSVLLVNIFWKISAHMAGIGGLCGILLAISSRMQINLHVLLITLFLCAGLVGYSRLKLNAHSSTQVYVGFLLGVVIPLILFL